jgi:hypothetical protein
MRATGIDSHIHWLSEIEIFFFLTLYIIIFEEFVFLLKAVGVYSTRIRLKINSQDIYRSKSKRNTAKRIELETLAIIVKPLV